MRPPSSSLPLLVLCLGCLGSAWCAAGASAFPDFARTDYATPRSPFRMASGDLNGDGVADLVVGCQSDPDPVLSVFLGNGDGTMGPRADYASGPNPTGVAIADYNRDGVPDLAAAIHLTNSAAVLLGRGDGTFGTATEFAVGSFPIDLVAADFNGDGNPDLAVTNSEDNTISVLLGDGNGLFQPQRVLSNGGFPEGIVAADVNGDGDVDLVTADFLSHAIEVQLGNGDGTFTQRPPHFLSQTNPIDLVAADLSGDGRIDIAVVNRSSSSVSVLLGNGDGTFGGQQNYATSSSPLGIDVADVDGDGRLDLAVTGEDADVVSLFPGNGDGTFGPRTDTPVGDGPVAMLAVDLNRDGHVDLVTSNAAPNVNTVSVLLNESGDLAARAYLTGSDKTIRLSSKNAQWCAQIEPIGGSFSVTEITPGSVELISPGTGSVSRISAISDNTMVVGDRDRNQIQDITACFRKVDLRLLFSSVQGKQTLTVAIEGTVLSGRRFHAPAQVTVNGGVPSAAASFNPNPFHPGGVLAFHTRAAGVASVALYNVRGGLVRRLLDRMWLPSGMHRVPLDGKGLNGAPLASGIYFYRIETAEGITTGRASILK